MNTGYEVKGDVLVFADCIYMSHVLINVCMYARVCMHACLCVCVCYVCMCACVHPCSIQATSVNQSLTGFHKPPVMYAELLHLSPQSTKKDQFAHSFSYRMRWRGSRAAWVCSSAGPSRCCSIITLCLNARRCVDICVCIHFITTRSLNARGCVDVCVYIHSITTRCLNARRCVRRTGLRVVYAAAAISLVFTGCNCDVSSAVLSILCVRPTGRKAHHVVAATSLFLKAAAVPFSLPSSVHLVCETHRA